MTMFCAVNHQFAKVSVKLTFIVQFKTTKKTVKVEQLYMGSEIKILLGLKHIEY